MSDPEETTPPSIPSPMTMTDFIGLLISIEHISLNAALASLGCETGDNIDEWLQRAEKVAKHIRRRLSIPDSVMEGIGRQVH